ncbi:hypothetical protein JTB14_037016 [Gonioctena quinquepunctata]|nr:hypothetical protein JTB14_037016 [Gonioctena quinquepunctata]
MRIVVAKGRRETGKSRVLTDTREKREIEEEHAQRVANRKKRTRNITKKIIPESSSSCEEDNLEFGKSSSDDADWPPQDHTHEDDKENEPIIKGDFWLTKLEGKKKIHYYIAEIIDVSNKEATIKYLKKMDGSTNKFLYENEKTYIISDKDVIIKLPFPISVGGSARKASQLAFSVDFNNYNVE